MQTKPAPSCPLTDSSNSFSPLSKLTASGLISIGICLAAMLFLVWHRFEDGPVAFSLLAFGVGGVILKGKPWAPALGTLYCLLLLLANQPLLNAFQASADDPAFLLIIFLLPIWVVTSLAGVGATLQHYFLHSAPDHSPIKEIPGPVILVILIGVILSIFLAEALSAKRADFSLEEEHKKADPQAKARAGAFRNLSA